MQPQSLQTADGEVLTLRSALCLALFYPRGYTTDRDHGHGGQWLMDESGNDCRNESRMKCLREAKRPPSTERRQPVGDPEQENQPKPAAVHRSRPCNQLVETRMMSAGIERAANRCSHKRIHRHQPQR